MKNRSILNPALIACERDLLATERVIWRLLWRVMAEPRRSILWKKHELICGILHNINRVRCAAMERTVANLEQTLPPHKLAKLTSKIQRDAERVLRRLERLREGGARPR